MKQNAEMDMSERDLRKFGYLMMGFFALVFGVLLPWLWSLKWALWPWIVAGVFGVLAFLRPSTLKGVHKYWMRFANTLGWINTRLILGVVFLLVFAPLGGVMRLVGRDTLKKNRDNRLATYRVSKKPRKTDHMERQF